LAEGGGRPTEAQFLVPDQGDKVDYTMGLSHRPTRLHRLTGNPLL
jgi:hypothetical protein